MVGDAHRRGESFVHGKIQHLTADLSIKGPIYRATCHDSEENFLAKGCSASLRVRMRREVVFSTTALDIVKHCVL